MKDYRCWSHFDCNSVWIFLQFYQWNHYVTVTLLKSKKDSKQCTKEKWFACCISFRGWWNVSSSIITLFIQDLSNMSKAFILKEMKRLHNHRGPNGYVSCKPEL